MLCSRKHADSVTNSARLSCSRKHADSGLSYSSTAVTSCYCGKFTVSQSVRIAYLEPLRSTFKTEAADVNRLLLGRPAVLRDGQYNIDSTETSNFVILI